MKKHLIAAAVAAAVAAPAMAQNVSLYGALDTSIMSVNRVAAGQNVGMAYIDGNLVSSVWGLRGSEDLGGGLRAVFQLESDVATNNGGMNSAGLFRRGAYAGVASSDLGELTFGVRTNPLIAANGATLPVGGNAVTTITAAALGYADFYTRNAVTYTSPAISGFTLQGQHGLSNTPESGTAGTVSAWRLSFAQGALSAQVAGQQRKSIAAATGNMSAANPPTIGNTAIDGSETLYNAVTGGMAASVNAASLTKNTLLSGIRYSFTKDLSVGVAYVRNEVTNVDGLSTRGSTGGLVLNTTAASKTTASATILGIGYQLSPALQLGANLVTAENSRLTNAQARYSLSKRTTAYAMYALADNDSANVVNFFPVGMNSGVAPAAVLGGTATTSGTRGLSQSALGAGIIHTF